MKLGEIVGRLVIDPRKFTAYALDPENPLGRHKAIVFAKRLGFSKVNEASLRQQIEALAPGGEAELQRTDQYGQHYRIDIEMSSTAGQQARVRTGWTVAPGSDTAHFVTCYVLRKA
jgi:filamentous hemagglutinin